MTPEEKKLLEKVASQVDENNGILRGIRRTQRMNTVMKILYWVLIIGLSLGAFYFIQPYVDMLKGVTGGDTNDSSQNSQLQDLLNGL
ncbi:MAG TPA: hypothetical protein VJI33_04930 [Candidatus Paceibacterota bacterium]